MKNILILVFVLMACTDYSKKVSLSNIEVYYKEGISKELTDIRFNTLRSFSCTADVNEPK